MHSFGEGSRDGQEQEAGEVVLIDGIVVFVVKDVVLEASYVVLVSGEVILAASFGTTFTECS